MAENQTATEDSGQQTHQHQPTQTQHQSSTSPQQQPPPTDHNNSPTASPPQDNSPSSPEDSQTIVISTTNNHSSLQNNNTSNSSNIGILMNEHNAHVRNMYGRAVNAKINATASQRRNTIHTVRPAPAALKLSKVGSLTNSSGGGGGNRANLSNSHGPEAGKHHHRSHHHAHMHNHNNIENQIRSQHIHRTTSESLRLSSLTKTAESSAGGETSTSQLSNATSNSSIQSKLNSNSSSSSPSANPPSTTTTNTTASTSKATSPSANAGGSSALASRTHNKNYSHSQGHHHHHHSHAAATSRKPKTTSSFQITSVTVGQPKPQVTDNGEESADDLDESHTDDNSRVTDATEPSMSEDTFSKEEVYYPNNALNSTAPAIPTSSQYGLVVVDPNGPVGQTIQNVQVNMSDNIINVVSATVDGNGKQKKDDLKDTQHRSERFKVVKIESTEPFRRGRWMCMDYLDHSSVGTGEKEGGGGNSNDKTGSSDTGNGENGIEPHRATQSMIIGTGAAALLENHNDSGVGNSLQLTSTSGVNDDIHSTSEGSPHPMPGGIATAPATVVHGMQQLAGTARSSPDSSQPAQHQLYNEGEATPNGGAQEVTHGQTLPMDYATAAAQQLQKSLAELKKQEDAIAASEKAAAAYVPGQSQPINFGGQQQQQPSQQHQPPPQQDQHGATLPGNLHFQNGAVASSADSNNQPTNEQQNSQATTQSAPRSMAYVDTQHQQHQQQLQQQHQQQHQQHHQQQQQPLSPVPHTGAQAQSPPSFITQQSGATAYNNIQQPQQQQNFQAPQQSAQVVNSDALSLPPQGPPPLQQQTSQTDSGGVNSPVTNAAVNMTQPTSSAAQPQLPAQFQQQPPHTAAGQTMPILSQMTSFDMQQGTQGTPSMTTPSQLHQQQSAPSTIADANAVIGAMQAQQQLPPPSQPVLIDSATNVTNEPTQLLQQQQLPSSANNPNAVNVSAANGNSNNATLTNLPTNATATVILSNVSATTSANVDDQTQQQQTAIQHHLQQNPENETESASGTSAVAIDNKIEQAMDLVKSHLMIAVREEVEVLKEKISELMDKINQLEVENTFLKANIPQETLQQLQMQTQLQQITGSANNGSATPTATASNMITAAPASTGGATVAASNAVTNASNGTATGTATASATDVSTTDAIAATVSAAVADNVTVLEGEAANSNGNAPVTVAPTVVNGPLS